MQKSTEEKEILVLGNQAIAHGLHHGGLKYAASYPGTPSTEIMEELIDISNTSDLKAGWSSNEAVALEEAAAAAISGVDSAFVCKSVGLNVAMDPLMTLANTGVNAALVIVVADDPSMHSSQNEQDNRYVGKFANLPVFAPSNIQEAYHYAREAIKISRKFKLPVILRTTTRLSHSLGKLIVQEKNEYEEIEYEKNPNQFVSIPANSRKNHIKKINTMYEVLREVENNGYWKEYYFGNEEEPDYLIISDGIPANYTLEVIEYLGISAHVFVPKVIHPLPEEKISQLLLQYENILIIEELEPYIEEYIRALAQKLDIERRIIGKGTLTQRTGEIVVEELKNNLAVYLGLKSHTIKTLDDEAKDKLLMRPPVLCAGCPHRSTYVVMDKVFKRKNPFYANDIGCYSLGVLPPHKAADTLISMGASIPMATSIAENHPDRLAVAVIGDSTFWHSGLPGLANAIWKNANVLIMVMDNQTTAMTGAQPNPTSEKDKLDIAKVAQSMGAWVREIDPMEYKESREVLREAVDVEGVRVIVSSYPCALMNDRAKIKAGIDLPIAKVQQDVCNGCQLCINTTGCPGLKLLENGKIDIDTSLCDGCMYCQNFCHRNAILEVERE